MTSGSAIANNKLSKDLSITVIFGVLSAVLGLIQIDTPGFEGSYSDLREVALLIAIFHIVNPVFIIPLCLLTLIGLPVETRMIAVFLMHVIPLFITWYAYRKILVKRFSTIKLGVIWFFVSLLYYTALIYPFLIVFYHIFGINEHLAFIESYVAVYSSGTLEMIATSLVTSVYLVQLNIRRRLEQTNKDLEKIVEERTYEITAANLKLKVLNESLERKVEERTAKINSQLNQILKYVHMNSHEVRAPLARILGLIQLIDKESTEEDKMDLLDKIKANSEELDCIIKKMNRTLEQEMD